MKIKSSAQKALSEIYGGSIPVELQRAIEKAMEEDRENIELEWINRMDRLERRSTLLQEELEKAHQSSVEKDQLFSARMDRVSREFGQREAALQAQNAELSARHADSERSFYERQKSLEKDFEMRSKQISARRVELEEKITEYENERTLLKDESQKRIQDNSKSFVLETVESLNTRGDGLSRIAFWWSIGGGVSLVAGAIALAVITIMTASAVAQDISWKQLIFYVLKGTVFIGASLVIARYSFIFSSNYMKESLRTFDRVHAIKFGQFFVNTYGATANWEQVQAVFSNWHGYGNSEWKSNPEEAIGEVIKTSEISSIVGSIGSLGKP